MNLIIKCMKGHLSSGDTSFVNLALQCVANMANAEMAETFAPELVKLLISRYDNRLE